MNKLLTLLALAGLSAAVGACGDDSGDKETETKDAAVKTDSSLPPPRGQQVSNLAAECTEDKECTGAGSVTCLKTFGGILGQAPITVPGGYCTAQCNYTEECGTNGSCPLAEILADPTVMSTLQGSPLSGLISQVIPPDCFETCTVGDAGGRGSCSRSDHLCRPLTALAGAAGGAGGLAGALTGIISGSNIAALKKNYCFPEIQLPTGDGGVGDAGRAAPITGGLDGGN